MYRLLRKPLFRILRVPEGPPPLPYGSPDAFSQFRAARGYLYHQLLLWGSAFVATIAFEVAALGEFTINVFGKEVDVIESMYDLPLAIVLAFTVLAALGKWLVILVDYDVRYYIVTDRNIRIRHGAMIVQEATYTFANIQNVTIRQGPIERLFGISTLTIQTAGGGLSNAEGQGSVVQMFQMSPGHEGVLRGVSNATELRERIQSLLRQHKDSGLGDPDDTRHAPTTDRQYGDRVGGDATAILADIRDELRAVHRALGT